MAVSHIPLPQDFKRQANRSQHWKEVVLWTVDLPPTSMVAARALELLDNPKIAASKLSEIIAMDPALAARTMRIANSWTFRRQREVTSLEQAVMLIGLKNLKGCLVSAALRHADREVSRLERLVWENSVGTALAGREICRRLRLAFEDEVYLLGLMHDFGKLVLLHRVPEQYAKVLPATRKGMTFLEGERKVTRFSHPLIGALVAIKWNFSEEICRIILKHHDELKDFNVKEAPEIDIKCAIVQLGDAISHHLGLGHDKGYPPQDQTISYLARAFRFTVHDLREIADGVRVNFDNIQDNLYGS